MNKFRTYMSVAALALAVSLTGCSVAGTPSSTGRAGSSTVSGAQSAVTVASVEQDTHFDSDDLS